MKVIIPIQGKESTELKIAQGFLDVEDFCVYNCDTQTFEFQEASSFTGDVGNLSLALKKTGISTMLIRSMDIVELGLFTESGFDIFKALDENLKENLFLFENGHLKKLTIQTALGISACSSSACGSCSSCN